MSATAGSPSSAEISPKKLPCRQHRELLAFEDDADLAVDDDVQADVLVAAAHDPLALAEAPLPRAAERAARARARSRSAKSASRETLSTRDVDAHARINRNDGPSLWQSRAFVG